MATNIKLDKAGVFTARAETGAVHLFYDGGDSLGRWIVVASRPKMAPGVVSQHMSLDEGLAALADLAALDERFAVNLPCGGKFSRPGRVDAVSVLAALGYVVTRNITAYAMVEAAADATPDEVRERVVEMLGGRAFTCGSVDVVERDERASFWCCDVGLPFEGPVSLDDAKNRLEIEFEGTGLSIAGCYDVTPSLPTSANAAKVIPLAALRAA